MADKGNTTETTRDSGKLAKPFDLATLIKAAKSNPWILALLALGGGTGGQELLAKVGQQVEWWWIALAVVGFGLMNYLTDFAKEVRNIGKDVADMKGDLKAGREKFEHLEEEVKSLKAFRHELTAEALKGHKPPRVKSQPVLRPEMG